MKRNRHTPEQAVRKVREGQRILGSGSDLTEVLRHLEITESTCHRWRRAWGDEPQPREEAQGVGGRERSWADPRRLRCPLGTPTPTNTRQSPPITRDRLDPGGETPAVGGQVAGQPTPRRHEPGHPREHHPPRAATDANHPTPLNRTQPAPRACHSRPPARPKRESPTAERPRRPEAEAGTPGDGDVGAIRVSEIRPA